MPINVTDLHNQPSNDYSDLMFADRLRAVRKARGMKQRDLAVKAGVTANQISEYERGVRTPGTAILEWICKALNVSASDLLGF